MEFRQSRKAHLTFGDSKRIISYEKDENVAGLRHRFLREFSDMLPDDVAPAHVKFQYYDDIFQDYVDLGNGQKLEENARIKAIVAPSKGNRVHSGCTSQADCSLVHPCHFVIPWYPIKCTDQDYPPDIKFHPLKKDVSYRFWNPVSSHLLQRAGSEVTCQGGFSDSVNTVIQAKSVGKNVFYLVFNGDGPSDNYLYITSQEEGEEVIVTSSPTEDSKFVPDYYWGQTMFRSKSYDNLYLGCNSNYKATLVPMQEAMYPNPQALFIVNQYDPPT